MDSHCRTAASCHSVWFTSKFTSLLKVAKTDYQISSSKNVLGNGNIKLRRPDRRQSGEIAYARRWQTAAAAARRWRDQSVGAIQQLCPWARPHSEAESVSWCSSGSVPHASSHTSIDSVFTPPKRTNPSVWTRAASHGLLLDRTQMSVWMEKGYRGARNL